ncbi:DUF6986 family protein [Euzebya tangerina]|uniref:DUF6986 family protein n=1 Tax=Euzebya tangerina TaxID=591198 RepID=UPI000E3195DB|nr:aldolase [Euzebya tangerina]
MSETVGRLPVDVVQHLLDGVADADRTYRGAWPGRPDRRQPVQVLYLPAHTVEAGTPRSAGRHALDLLDRHDGAGFAAALGLDHLSAAELDRVVQRVRTKLEHEPVEDLRVDFEDGYVGHGPGSEDADSVSAAVAVARMMADGSCPPFVGLRVKSFTDGLAARSVATLDRFVSTLLDEAGRLPDGFVVTFPKIISVDHVHAFVEVLAALEQANGLPTGTLGFEAQIETTASVLGPDGRVALRDIRAAGEGRLRAVHFGVFDYTAALGLPSTEQRLDHPACDFARHLMQVTFAGTEVRLSDGSTNVRPADDTTASVHAAWQVHAAHVRHSLAHGFWQGWDLHPSHLVSRYTTVFAHLLDGIAAVEARVRAWEEGTAAGAVMDEPATLVVLRRRLDLARSTGALPS